MRKFRVLSGEEREKIKAYLKQRIDGGERNARVLSDEVAAVFNVDHNFDAIIQLARKNWDAMLSGAPAERRAPAGITPERFRELAADFLTKHAPLPPVPDYIRATKLEDMGFDTVQHGVALFSDLHYYSEIDRRVSNGLAEYNIDIARERLARWRNGVLRFTQLAQLTTTVDTLHLWALGDDMEGHGEMFASQKIQMSEAMTFQIIGFVEDVTGALLEFLQRYEKVIIYKVPGNHGRHAAKARGAYTPDNFELQAWHTIGERLRATTGGEWSMSENGVLSLTGGQIDLHIHHSVMAIVDIFGWTCVGRHGHGLKGLNSTYTGALDNKLRMNSVIGQVINYYFKAHLHEAQSAEHEIRGEVIQNGCFVGPSLLSIEMARPASNLPSQEFMLFHPRHGKTTHNRIHLATPDEVRKLQVIGR